MIFDKEIIINYLDPHIYHIPISMTRLASTGMTGGTGNFLVATMENLSSAILSILALTLPFLAAGLVMGLLILAITKIAQFLPLWWRGKPK
ncbi:MAG: DUF4126 family protein [Pleurocapsa sp.]